MIVTNLNKLNRNEDLNIRKLDEVYYFTIRGNAYESNEIGATIVNAVGRDMSIDELCIRIASKYAYNDINQIKSDIDSYIEFLLAEGILLESASENG